MESRGIRLRWRRLTPLVYDVVCIAAANYLRNQRPDHTLQANRSVHEAYLHLLDLKEIEWNSRAHFIGPGSPDDALRTLVDHARKRMAERRWRRWLGLVKPRAAPVMNAK